MTGTSDATFLVRGPAVNSDFLAGGTWLSRGARRSSAAQKRGGLMPAAGLEGHRPYCVAPKLP